MICESVSICRGLRLPRLTIFFLATIMNEEFLWTNCRSVCVSMPVAKYGQKRVMTVDMNSQTHEKKVNLRTGIFFAKLWHILVVDLKFVARERNEKKKRSYRFKSINGLLIDLSRCSYSLFVTADLMNIFISINVISAKLIWWCFVFVLSSFNILLWMIKKKKVPWIDWYLVNVR